MTTTATLILVRSQIDRCLDLRARRNGEMANEEMREHVTSVGGLVTSSAFWKKRATDKLV